LKKQIRLNQRSNRK